MTRYPLFKVKIDSEDASIRIKSVIDSGFVNEGEQVTEFEEALKENLGVKNLIAMNSATSALTIAYKVAGVGPGKEVISSPMTCIATNTPILNLGGKIIWADVVSATGNIDVASVRRKISPRTAAIVYVDWAGNPAELEALQDLGKSTGIAIVQDAAHAYGATWNGKSIASFADFTCYSFQAIKHLSCGDGGALVCSSEEDYLLARKLKWFGYDRQATKDAKGNWKGQRWEADILPGEAGFKFNMNNISAAIGLSSIVRIEQVLEAHRRNADVLQRILSKSKHFEIVKVPERAKSSYWVYTVLTNLESQVRDSFLQKLNQFGIEAGLVHLPNDIYSAFGDSKADLPGVRSFANRQISLPCGWWLSEADCEVIGETAVQLIEDFVD